MNVCSLANELADSWPLCVSFGVSVTPAHHRAATRPGPSGGLPGSWGGGPCPTSPTPADSFPSPWGSSAGLQRQKHRLPRRYGDGRRRGEVIWTRFTKIIHSLTNSRNDNEWLVIFPLGGGSAHNTTMTLLALITQQNSRDSLGSDGFLLKAFFSELDFLKM